MFWLNFVDTSRVLLLSLVLTRVSGIVITAPVFGGSDIPMQFRALFAFAMTVLMMPLLWFTNIAEPPTLVDYVIVIFAELIIGLSIGLCISLFFGCVIVAGAIIGQVGGLFAASVLDPTSGEEVPTTGRFLHLLAITIFASMGGLRVLISALLDTFETLPLGTGIIQTPLVGTLVSVLSLGFGLALRLAAPAMIGVLLSLFVMGILSRTLPQLNLMSIGFGINSMLMMILLICSLGAGMICFQERIGDVLILIFDGLRTPIVLEPH
ncbi:MAG: flagellar biosynthetic protein FliR [Thermoguttaceae bacterium]